MKILLITEDFIPFQGGVFTFLHNLCLVSNSEIHVLTTYGGISQEEDFDKQQSYRIERIHLPPRLGFFFLFIKTFHRSFTFCPDVIFWGHATTAAIIGWLIKKIFGPLFVMLVHGTEMNLSLNGGFLPRRMILSALHRADLIFVNSQDTGRRVGKLRVLLEKISILNPGVNVHQFYPDPETTEIIQRYHLINKRVLLSVSRLVPKKNHPTMLRALRKVLTIISDTVYMIVGDGPEETLLRRLSEDMGLNNNVIFVPYTTGENLRKLYNACDVFVMASKTAKLENQEKMLLDVESFGIVFVEAGACGKPVIGGRSGGVADAVVDGHTGLLVDPENEETMAESIILLLTDKVLAQRFGNNGRYRAIEELSWEKVAGRFDSAIKSCFLKQGKNYCVSKK